MTSATGIEMLPLIVGAIEDRSDAASEAQQEVQEDSPPPAAEEEEAIADAEVVEDRATEAAERAEK